MFLHPLGLLALLGVPTVVALHLFRRRFRPEKVSALFLWIEDDENLMAGRRRERLRTNASFWLETIAALLIALVFAGPRACGSGTAQHLVIVLDASASMGATEAGGESLRDRAVDVVRERIGDLSSGSKVTVITSGSRPTLLAGPAAFPQEAVSKLSSYQPSTARHALSPAVALGLQLSGDGAVLVITDRHEPDAFPPEVELEAIGSPAENVAITHAARSREQTEGGDLVERVLVTVTAFTRTPVTRELAVTSGGDTLRTQSIELEPDQRRHFAFEVPLGTGAVVVTLDGDTLPIDDSAYLAPNPTRGIKLSCALDPPVAKSLGLASGASPSLIDRLLELVPDAEEVEDPEEAQLFIGHAIEGNPRTWSLSIEGDLALEAEPEDLIGPFLAERRHRVLEGVTLEGIVWSATPSYALEGAPIVSAGNLVLLSETATDTSRHFHLNINPFRSTLQRSPDWPILLANLTELRRAELPGPRRSNVAVGDVFQYHGDEPKTYHLEPLLLAPGSSAEARDVPARDVLVLEDLEAPGIYSLSAGSQELARIGVSFKDPQESDLRDLSSGNREPTVARSTTLTSLGPLETLLLAAALVCIVMDWWVLFGMHLRTKRLFRSAAGSPS